MLVGMLPLTALAADQEGMAAPSGPVVPLLPPSVSYVLAQADLKDEKPGAPASRAPVAQAPQPERSPATADTAAATETSVAGPGTAPSGEAPAAVAPASPAAAVEPAASVPAAVTAPAADEIAKMSGTLAAPEPSITAALETPPGDRLALKTEQQLSPNQSTDDDVPIFIKGLKISGRTGMQTDVEGDAELRKRGSLIKADTITYFPVQDEMLANGEVRALKDGDLFTGSQLRLKLDAQTGYFLDVHYLLAGEKARGEAMRMDFLGQNAYHAENATYTTCGPGNDDWFLKVGKMNLDFGRDLGEAEDAQIVFLGREILALPSMSFSLNDKRKSGFLAPSFGSSIQSGQELTVPYYWNIAPNRDATLTERYLSKRGLQSSASFRYMGDTYKGQISGEVLPDDSQTRTTRSGFSILHTQTLAPGLTANLNVNKVSDNTYFTDLSAKLALTAQTFLTREGSLNYTNNGYNLSIRAQAFQTLQDPLAPVAVPYFRLPELSFSTLRYDVKGFDIGFESDYTRFSNATQVMGSRSYVAPSISYPFIRPGYYITPKITFNSTHYNLENLSAWQTGVSLPSNAREGIVRNVPIASVDSGMTFERQADYFGKDYTQTLEPRIYYLRVPYRDQSNIPIFDTGAADFNFSQIFSDNIYSGLDRIADANQLTAAVSTRLLSTDSGAERLRVSIGQRYYFASQRVTLPGENARVDKTSDYLAAISGDIVPKIRFDSAIEYDPNLKEIQRVTHGIRWSPEPGNTVSAAYRYQRDLLEEVDFAGQWRVTPRWYGVGRYNYSLRDGHLAEALAGFEYDGDCWVGRVVLQKYALATQRTSSSIFFQIELNGLSRLGSNPLDILRRNIPGYTKLYDNQTAQPRTFNNYE
ncbi:MAG TPA: LPS-assembly protein LptD [Burkholderiales bacterium]|jgi:LPS-assembly protein|nr:LPS-assembly protein LptD [Burkholderiales bacterium]